MPFVTLSYLSSPGSQQHPKCQHTLLSKLFLIYFNIVYFIVEQVVKVLFSRFLFVILFLVGIQLRLNIIYSPNIAVDEIVLVDWMASWFRLYWYDYLTQLHNTIYPPASPVMANPPLLPMVSGLFASLLDNAKIDQLYTSRMLSLILGLVCTISVASLQREFGSTAVGIAFVTTWLAPPMVVASSTALVEIGVATAVMVAALRAGDPLNYRRGILLGIVFGIGLLCKLSFLPFLISGLIVIASRAWIASKSLVTTSTTLLILCMSTMLTVLLLWPSARSMSDVLLIFHWITNERQSFPTIIHGLSFHERIIQNIAIVLSGVSISSILVFISICVRSVKHISRKLYYNFFIYLVKYPSEIYLIVGGILFILFVSFFVSNPSRHQLVPIFPVFLTLLCKGFLRLQPNPNYVIPNVGETLYSKQSQMPGFLNSLKLPLLASLWVIESSVYVVTFRSNSAMNHSSWMSELTRTWPLVPLEPGFGLSEAVTTVNMVTAPGQPVNVEVVTHVTQALLTQNRRVVPVFDGTAKDITGPLIRVRKRFPREAFSFQNGDSRLISSVQVGPHEAVEFSWVGQGGPLQVQPVLWRTFRPTTHNGLSSAYAFDNGSDVDFLLSSLISGSQAVGYLDSYDFDCVGAMSVGLIGRSSGLMISAQLVDSSTLRNLSEITLDALSLSKGISFTLQCANAEAGPAHVRIAAQTTSWHGRLNLKGVVARY